jgi:hypothetical protein
VPGEAPRFNLANTYVSLRVGVPAPAEELAALAEAVAALPPAGRATRAQRGRTGAVRLTTGEQLACSALRQAYGVLGLTLL